MNRTTRNLSLVAVAGLFASGAILVPAMTAHADPTADESLATHLTFMREEERMARDLYTAIDAHYADVTRPFSNIVKSEQQHFEMVGTLLTTYGLDDPSQGQAAGTYADADLEASYAALLKQAKTSLDDAYKVGIAVEKADVADLDEAMADITQSDADEILAGLKRASENHLAAFERAADGQLGTGQGRDGNGQRGRGMNGQMQRAQGQDGRGQNDRGQMADGTGRGRMGGPGNGQRQADCPLG